MRRVGQNGRYREPPAVEARYRFLTEEHLGAADPKADMPSRLRRLGHVTSLGISNGARADKEWIGLSLWDGKFRIGGTTEAKPFVLSWDERLFVFPIKRVWRKGGIDDETK